MGRKTSREEREEIPNLEYFFQIPSVYSYHCFILSITMSTTLEPCHLRNVKANKNTLPISCLSNVLSLTIQLPPSSTPKIWYGASCGLSRRNPRVPSANSGSIL